MDRQAYERIKEQGRTCRRNGGKRESNPYRGASVRDEATAWEAGFNEVESERKARAAR